MHLKNGDYVNITYRGYDFTLNYFTCENESYVIVEIDGHKKVFKRSFSDDPHGIYWRKDRILISIKPVVWEYRNGKKVPIYEKSWNAKEVLVEIWGW